LIRYSTVRRLQLRNSLQIDQPAIDQDAQGFISSARISSVLALSLIPTGLLGSPASFMADNRACR
jgi:hypothetical protein